MQQQRGQPNVVVINTNVNRETGRKAQQQNIQAAYAVSDIIRTCLGPRAMLKMVLDPMGGIQLTNDGHAILRELDVNHPAAKAMQELSRAQDEEIGDGTTSVVILAGSVLNIADPWLERKIHPLHIISGYKKALDEGLESMKQHSIAVDINDNSKLKEIVSTTLGTKFVSKWMDLFCDIAINAVKIVSIEENGRKEIDIKQYARIEKIPGGEISDCQVFRGVMLNKDVTHAKMRRYIKNPRVILLDCPLEYKKAESQISIDVTNEEHWKQILQEEEEYVAQMCRDILKYKPDLVITEKGLSDLAQHFFVKAGVTALRRAKKTDNNRIARITGATICTRPDEIQESDVGTQAGLFEVRKIGDEYFSFIEDSPKATACTILLRGASKDVLNEIERNLHDAMNIARTVIKNPRLVPGGGAIEMAVSQTLLNKSKSIKGIEQWIYQGIANALEVIPRTLAQNCGEDVVKLLTELRAKHSSDPIKNFSWGIDGMNGGAIDVSKIGLWEPLEAKMQTFKSAVECACMLLRVDEVVSGTKGKGTGGMSPNSGGPGGDMME